MTDDIFWSTQHLSLVSRKIQIKAALQFSFNSLKMAKAKQGNDKKYWWDFGKEEPLHIIYGSVNWGSHCENLWVWSSNF